MEERCRDLLGYTSHGRMCMIYRVQMIVGHLRGRNAGSRAACRVIAIKRLGRSGDGLAGTGCRSLGPFWDGKLPYLVILGRPKLRHVK